MKTAFFLLLLLLAPVVLVAQSNTGSIVGTIKGADGAVIPNVAVTITNQLTNRQFTVTTNGDGYFVSPPLQVGEYQVEAKQTGFKAAVRPKISLQIQQTVTVDFTLEVGALSDQITITAETPVLETTSTTFGQITTQANSPRQLQFGLKLLW